MARAILSNFTMSMRSGRLCAYNKASDFSVSDLVCSCLTSSSSACKGLLRPAECAAPARCASPPVRHSESRIPAVDHRATLPPWSGRENGSAGEKLSPQTYGHRRPRERRHLPGLPTGCRLSRAETSVQVEEREGDLARLLKTPRPRPNEFRSCGGQTRLSLRPVHRRNLFSEFADIDRKAIRAVRRRDHRKPRLAQRQRWNFRLASSHRASKMMSPGRRKQIRQLSMPEITAVPPNGKKLRQDR